MPPPPLDRPVLADTTVWSKVRGDHGLAAWFNDEVQAGRILVCDVVMLELLKSARSPQAHADQAAMLGLLGEAPTTADVLRRSREVQGVLASRSQHRGVPPADLIIAASAEIAGVPLIHYDRDYDLIAEATDQDSRWFVPRGSLA